MCGILGSVGATINENLFRDAACTIKHRGPDDTGFYINHDERTYLAHQRLSIIDLSSAGHQPFLDKSGRYKLVFNGEIYNYVELKETLKNDYDFTTATDTEVLLASYLKWGEGCVEHFNGMFAFAIWDSVKQTLFCARDRLGIKPFFYTKTESAFIFSSEIKGLLSFVSPKQNEKVISDYLLYGFYDHTNETFFDNIYSLEPGHTLTFSKGNLSLSKYWDVKDKQVDYSGFSTAELHEKFRDLLKDSIKLRFRSDVPVGINLSSGLDSNVLHTFAKSIVDYDINLFSMCSDEEAYNECRTIGSILSESDREHWHQSVFTSTEFIDAIDRMNVIQDQPYGGVPTLAYGKLNELAKEKQVTVLLEGQGVDELLGGYKYYRIEFIKDMWRRKQWGRLLQFARKQRVGSLWHNLQMLFEQKNIFSHSYSQDTTPLVWTHILSDNMRNAKRALQFEQPFESFLLNAQYRDLRFAKLPRVLRFNDHASMHFGRELRLPFLDHRLVEFAFWLPEEQKISYNAQKVIARKAFGDVLPQKVQQTNKIAFGAVQTEWLRKYGKDLVYSIINSSTFKQRGYWDHKALQKQVDGFFAGEGSNSFYLWQVINLELWFRRYIK